MLILLLIGLLTQTKKHSSPLTLPTFTHIIIIKQEIIITTINVAHLLIDLI